MIYPKIISKELPHTLLPLKNPPFYFFIFRFNVILWLIFGELFF